MKELPSPTFSLSPIALPRGLLDRSVQLVRPVPLAPAAVSSIQVSWARNLDEVCNWCVRCLWPQQLYLLFK